MLKKLLPLVIFFFYCQTFAQDDFATVHIYRSKAFCIGCKVTVLIDNRQIGDLENGGELIYQAFKIKNTNITITDGVSYKSSIDVNLKKDATYYFNADAKLPRSLGFKLEQLPDAVSKTKLDSKHIVRVSDAGIINELGQNLKSDTDWNRENLIEHWHDNKISNIEGIYEKVGTSLEYNLAVLKDQNEYKLIYLSGANGTSWKVGDIKAILQKTASFGLFKAKWKMLNKEENKDILLTFTQGGFTMGSEDGSGNDTYIKVFPTYDDGEDIKTSQKVDWSSSGTGFFISKNGYIATNYHVISDGDDIKVEINNKNYHAKLIISDKQNDLAILKIDDPSFKPLEKIEYNFRSETVDVGTAVFALGYPMTNIMGNEIKFTDGRISSKSGFKDDIRLYQISVPIQHGNSGGPLFDEKGNLVGITSSGLDKTIADNANYAIKTKYLSLLVEELGNNITLPNYQLRPEISLSEKIKILQKYVVFIKVK